MGINWTDLSVVFVATLISAVLLVVLFSVGVLGLSRREVARERGGSGAVTFAGSMVCFALCVVIVAYGIYLIVAK